jgi:hypothetical protein
MAALSPNNGEFVLVAVNPSMLLQLIIDLINFPVING